MSIENEPLIINPYIAGSPVKDAAMFFGREDVYAWLRQHLRGAYQHNAIVLYGERRSGKTSVLYQMKDKLGDPLYIPVLLDLQGMGLEGIDGFLWEVSRKVVLALRGVEGIPPLERPARQDFEKGPRNQFEDVFLPRIVEALGKRSLLLMFDEANRLAEKIEAGDLPADIFDYLRALIQESNQINFLFSLGNRLEANSSGSSQLFNLAVYRKISFLEQDFAEDLIVRPVANNYTITRPAIDRIYQLTSGQAYYTQLLCHNLFTRWSKDKPAQLGVTDVEAVLADVIEQGTPNFQFVWEDSSPVERAILAALANKAPQYRVGVMRRNLRRAMREAKLHPASGDVTGGLRRLFERDVINDQEPFAFRVGLMQQWINKFRRLEWVREELGDIARQWDKEEEQRRAQAPTARERARRWVAPVLAVVVIALLAFTYMLSRQSAAAIEAAQATGAIAAAQFEATRAAFDQALAEKQAELVIASTRAAEAEESGDQLQAEAARATAIVQAAEVQQLQAENTRAAGEAATAAVMAALPTTALPIATNTPLPPPTETSTPLPPATSTPRPRPTDTPRPSLAASLRGTLAYPAFDGQTYHIYFVNLATGDSRRFRTEASQPAFNSEGSRIAFQSWAGNPRGLMTVNLSSGSELLITNFLEDAYPTWSPDGGTILFLTRRSGGRESQLWWTPSDRDFQANLTRFVGKEGEYPYWGANNQIIFKGWQSTGTGLRLASPDFATIQQVTTSNQDYGPALSPDGRQVVFMSQRDGNWEVYRVNTDGSDLQRLTTDSVALDGLPTWSPDGRAIAYASNTGGEWAIWAVSPNGGSPQKLFSMVNSPDGQVASDRANSRGWVEERISWAP
jgi:Tol biopolymer transport system component